MTSAEETISIKEKLIRLLEEHNERLEAENLELQNQLKFAESSARSRNRKRHKKREGRRILKLVSINGKCLPGN